jgi:hypothetical protein
VLAALAPLLESGVLQLPSRGQVCCAAVTVALPCIAWHLLALRLVPCA